MRPTRILPAVAAAAVLAAGCAGSSGTPTAAGPSPAAATTAAGAGTAALPAAEILARAQAALAASESVRLRGGGSSEGSSFDLDMRYATGARAVGTVTANRQTVELRRLGDVIYLKATAAFWQQSAGAEAARVLGGKWLKAPLTDQRVAALAAFTDKDTFTKEVLAPDGTVTKGERGTVNGTPAIGLRSAGSGGAGTLWVAATGAAVPLQLMPDAGTTDAGRLDFLDYGRPVEVPVPPAAEVVDAARLGG